MKYLVLTRFRTYGKQLEKGMVVDESEIRSPLLRMSEGKIVPAVSSSTAPVEPGEADEADPGSQGKPEDDDKGEGVEGEPEAEADEPSAEAKGTPEEPKPKKPFLSFGHRS